MWHLKKFNYFRCLLGGWGQPQNEMTVSETSNLNPGQSRLPVVFMFSGHGTQYPQMGKLFYENEPVFKQVLDRGEALAAPLLGSSLLEELFRERARGELFDRTKFTHPSLFLVQWGMVELLKSYGIHPQMLIGSSLGELTAMAAAGVWGFEEMLTRCCQEGAKVEQICPPGGMTAVIYDVKSFEQDEVLYSNVELAGVNLAKNFIISGANDKLALVENHLQEKGIFYQRLPVRQGFHSKLMLPFEPELRKSLQGFGTRSPNLPLWSCVTTQELTQITETEIWDVVIKPIQMLKAIQNLEARGPWHYLDCGPSGTMATALKYILPTTTSSRFDPLMMQFGKPLENLKKVVSQLGNS